jgi:hypothetical protein
MEELDRLKKGLNNSQTMLLKYEEQGLKCSFISQGIVKDDFLVQDEDLAVALNKNGLHGVIEGKSFERLRNNYGWFSLHVKSRKLLKELQ